MTFTDAALPRVETASLIRFVFVEASELLRVKTELVSGQISTTRQDADKRCNQHYLTGVDAGSAVEGRLSSGLSSAEARSVAFSKFDGAAGGAAGTVELGAEAAGEGWAAAGAVLACKTVSNIKPLHCFNSLSVVIKM